MIRMIPILTLMTISIASAGCTSLSYPADDATPAAADIDAETEMQPERPAMRRARLQPETGDSATHWNELIQMARELQRRGKLEEAGQRLEQAAALVAGLPAGHARRRAVFGTRARFAEHLANVGEIDQADTLADQLIAEASAEPEIAGSSFVSLALSVAERREMAARRAMAESDDPSEIPSQFELRRVALVVAQTESASRKRLEVAAALALEAYDIGNLEVARMAIDQATSDLLILAPSALAIMVELRQRSARIGLAEGDFETAIADATRANQILEELDASQSQRGYGEALLAQILARSGDTNHAMAIARGARARLEGDEPIVGAARRAILAATARVESALGHTDLALAHYDKALAVEEVDTDQDRQLVEEILLERMALAAPETN